MVGGNFETGGGIVFGSEEILAFMRRSVGVRGDASDTAGSLHSKVKKLSDDALAALVRAPWNAKNITITAGYTTSNKTADDVWHDYAAITGPRTIIGGYVRLWTPGSTTYVSNRLLIDGVSVFSFATPDYLLDAGTRPGRLPIGYFKTYDGTGYQGGALGTTYDGSDNSVSGGEWWVIPFGTPIQSSFNLQYQVQTGGSSSYAARAQWGLWHVAA